MADKFRGLQGILSSMKKAKARTFLDDLSKFGNSGMFNYATNKVYKQDKLKALQLETWSKFSKYELDNSPLRLPLNGFEEMILLTERGRLWKYPIDNEQGMEAEKQVPFEDHVFFDQYLEEFPKSEYIQTFMENVSSGLARNYWMTVDRKREIIKFYKEYFEERIDKYKDAGLEV